MEQRTRYKGLADDLRQECLNCRVHGGCNPSDAWCGRRRGVEYGLYPRNCLYMPTAGVPQDVSMQLNHGVGFKEEPLWRQNDGMTEFVKKVAKYEESWMVMDKWQLTY